MNIKTLVRRLTAATLLPVLLGLPMPSLAASQSPQQALTSALKNEMTRTTGSMQMAGRLGFEYAPMKRGEPVGKGSVAFSMSARALSATNGEGRLSIDSAEASGIPDMPEGVTIESPLSIQWKMVDGTFYVQLEKAPDSLLAMSKDQMGMDLGLILGRWIKFDTGANTSTDFFKLLSSGDLARGLRIKNFFDRNSILQVTRVEKRTKNAAGEDIWRMRVRVNPAVVNFFYREALRNLPKSGKARTDALKSLNASFVKIRVSLARTSMAVNVNVTKKLIERFEVGGKYPETTKTGKTTITVAVGTSMSPNAGEPVFAPSPALTPEEVTQLLYPRTPTPVGDLQLNDTSTLTAPGAAVPPYDLTTDHALGSDTARISLITYSDFQCPYCARFVTEAKQLLNVFPQDVRWVYRHFPLSGIHPEAQKAAEASECAAKLGGNGAFWQMHDKLFDNQAVLNRDRYLSFAGQIGLDVTTFTTCLDSGEMASRVKRDADTGTALGIQGTPTSYFGETQLMGALPFSVLQSEAEIAGAVR